MPPTLASSDPSSDRDFGVPSDEYDAALGRWNTVFLATLLWSGVCSPRPPARPPVSAWLQRIRWAHQVCERHGPAGDVPAVPLHRLRAHGVAALLRVCRRHGPALGLAVSPISSCAPAHLPTAGSVLSRRGMARTIHGNGIKLIIVTAVLPQLGTVFCGIARVGLLDRCASPPRLAEYGIPA